MFFFFSSRRRHTRSTRDWSSDVCSSDLRWAAKEAVAKLLGVGLRGLGGAGRPDGALAWTEIEVLSDPQGRPTLALHGRAADRARVLGLGPIALSLAHTREHAIANATALADQRRTTNDER